MPVITVPEIHVAVASDLSTLKDRIVTDYQSGNLEDNWAQNHIWREFNKRCIILGQESLMKVPDDAGHRPLDLDVFDFLVTIFSVVSIETIDGTERIAAISV